MTSCTTYSVNAEKSLKLHFQQKAADLDALKIEVHPKIQHYRKFLPLAK